MDLLSTPAAPGGPVAPRGRATPRTRTSGLSRACGHGAAGRLAGALAVSIVLVTVGCASAPAPTSYGVTEAGSQMQFGVKMAQRGLWDEALFRFQQAQRLDATSATGYNNIAVAQEALGLYEEALESYQKGLRLAPSNPDLKRNYARFVEFYQNFKPDEPEPGASDADLASGTEARGTETADQGVDAPDL